MMCLLLLLLRPYISSGKCDKVPLFMNIECICLLSDYVADIRLGYLVALNIISIDMQPLPVYGSLVSHCENSLKQIKSIPRIRNSETVVNSFSFKFDLFWCSFGSEIVDSLKMQDMSNLIKCYLASFIR